MARVLPAQTSAEQYSMTPICAEPTSPTSGGKASRASQAQTLPAYATRPWVSPTGLKSTVRPARPTRTTSLDCRQLADLVLALMACGHLGDAHPQLSARIAGVLLAHREPI